MFPKMPSLAEWGLGDGVGDNLYTLTIKQTRMDQRFISAGGATWYSNTLNLLTKGARIWVKVPPSGFVGVGLVTGPRQAAAEFQIAEHIALEGLNGNYHRHYVEDSERMEYFVSVRAFSDPLCAALRHVVRCEVAEDSAAQGGDARTGNVRQPEHGLQTDNPGMAENSR